MALQESNQNYAYPWIDDQNCIILPNKNDGSYNIDEKQSIEKLLFYLQQPEKLYEIYLNCIDNIKNYRIDNYLTKHIIPKIQKI